MRNDGKENAGTHGSVVKHVQQAGEKTTPLAAIATYQ